MKKLARFILACFAAQLLFAVTTRANISTIANSPKNPVHATPDDGGPFEGWAMPDDGGPFEGWATPDDGGPFEGW